MNRRNFIKACAAMAILGPVSKRLPKGVQPPIPAFIQRGKSWSVNPEWLDAPYEFSLVFPNGNRPGSWKCWPLRFADLESAQYLSDRVVGPLKAEIVNSENDPIV